MSEFKSLFDDNAVMGPADVRGGDGVALRGGFEVEGGQKETPGTVFGQTPTLFDVKDGARAGTSITGVNAIDDHSPGMTIKD